MIITGNVLTPDEGKLLTNGETVSDRVYLGIHDSPENWRDCEPDYDPTYGKEEATAEEIQQALEAIL